MIFKLEKSSKKVLGNVYTSSNVISYDYFILSPFVTAKNKVNPNIWKSSMSRWIHQVVHKSKKNLPSISELILTFKYCYAGLS